MTKEDSMHYRAMFRGDYIAAVELPEGREVTRTIRDVRMVAMEQSDGTVKEKPVCYFRESDRGWVLNRTNAECLAAMFGEDTADWSGSRVTIHREQVSLGREKVPGIRVVGSPDLDRPVRAEVKLPRRKPRKVTLRVTGDGKRSAPEPDGRPVPPEYDDAAAAFGGEE